MSDPIRVALERLIELRDADATWGLHWDEAIDAARAALAKPVGEGPSNEDLLESAAKALGYKSIPSDETCLTAEASELLDFARAILNRWGHPAAPPAPDHVNLIGFAFGREPWATWLRQGGCLESAHCELSDLMLAVLAKWGRPAAPPAPEVGEVGLLVDSLNQVAGDFDFLCNKIVNGECRTLACLRRGGYDDELCRARGIKPPDPLVATCPALEKAGAMRRAATLLEGMEGTAQTVQEEVRK